MANPNKVEIDLDRVFPKEKYDYFRSRGLTDAEIKTLEEAEALANVTDIIPDDPSGPIDRIESLPNNIQDSTKAMYDLASKDPKAFAEMMAVVEAIDQLVISEQSNNK